jgi:Na+/H+ antiporter NhaD/arsenite permease-like protein
MNLLIISIFIAGYILIAAESSVKINKAASALLTGVLCWTVYALMAHDEHLVNQSLSEHLSDIAGILFFLMGAMTIVEIVDAHDGFEVITSRITTTNKKRLLYIICLLSFFLSAILDNLTTTIVMITMLRKLTDDRNDRLLFSSMIVIAANAGGAWSPIGDVTTTMLWIGGQITPINIILKLFIPSLLCLLVPLFIVGLRMKGNVVRKYDNEEATTTMTSIPERKIVLCVGLGALIFVPVFKTITHLPPYMGVLLGLGILWTVTEIMHLRKENHDKDALSVSSALQKIDVPSILFFLGILTAIAVMQSTGILATLAQTMDDRIGNLNIIVPLIGILSAIIDNVPLVAASMGMYDLASYPSDSYLWEFLAYCSGTGGSILIIGSAAGVAAMGMEDISFIWYLKKISWLAFLGYVSGALWYMASAYFFQS